MDEKVICRFQDAECHKCGKIGNLKSVCRSKVKVKSGKNLKKGHNARYKDQEPVPFRVVPVTPDHLVIISVMVFVDLNG